MSKQWDIENYRSEHTGKLIGLTSVGCYPVVYWNKDGDAFCSDCADKAIADDDYEKPVWGDVYYEGSTEFCFACDRELESAYGDPEAEEVCDE